MKRNHWQFLVYLILPFSFCSITASAQLTKFDLQLARRFAKQITNDPQEKAYLQTDKPYYCAGENIWFKGYVVNAATHVPKTLSQFLYLELIDKSNTVITRVKIRKDSLGFAGHIKLKPEMEAGSYCLRAYTYWMQNATPDFFFSKIINIGNPIDDHINGRIDFGSINAGKVEATITFSNANKEPLSALSIDVLQSWDNPQNKKNTFITNKEGKINMKLSIDTTHHLVKYLEASINSPGNKYNKKFYLPEFNTDFDIQFFPESGTLLSDTLQEIAFKAIGTDGLSVDVKGSVYSGSNDEVVQFASTYKGMGMFSVALYKGEHYYVKVKSSKGIEKKIDFPIAQPKGMSLHLVHNRGKVFYEVINKTDLPNSAYYLLAHSRGRVFIIQQLKSLNGQITESIIPSGIASFSVIDSLGITYCERIYFKRENNPPVLKMETDKPIYEKRKPVELNLNIISGIGKPVKGNFSIAVTDNHSVKLDSLKDNIQSYFLLSSDIKGYIEEPGGYFTSNINIDQQRLDLLMMTQGWKRFNTSDIVKEKYPDVPYFMEVGQTISGKVVGLFNKPSKKCGIIMISTFSGRIKIAQTDSLGRYFIDGFEFPDSTSLILKANKSKGIGDVEIIPDPEVFPKASAYIPYMPDNSGLSAEYLKQSKENYFDTGGMRVIDLSGVTVKAAKKEKEASHYYSGMEDNKFDAAKLDNYPGMGIMDVLVMIPGIQVNGDNVSIRGNSRSPLFMINEVESNNMDDIKYLTTNDVEEISVFKGANTAVFGSKGNAGVIAITLKKGGAVRNDTQSSIATVIPLGFQKPAQFYVPKYQVDSVRNSSQPDMRTTIYWNPKLVADSSGTVHVKFYTADETANYSVVLEGVTASGEICRYVGTLKREDK